MGVYVSKYVREQAIKLLVAIATVDEMKEDEPRNKKLFGKGWPWLKQGSTLITKALHDGLSEIIGGEEALRIHRLAQQYKIVLLRQGEPRPENSVSIEPDHLFDIAMHAMGNSCAGCTITDHQGCSLYKALHAVELPPASYEEGKCPYLQTEEETK